MKKQRLLLPFLCLALTSLAGCGGGSEYVPPSYTDEQFEYLLGEFYGVDGTLTVSNDSLVIAGETNSTYYPTDLKEEKIHYFFDDGKVEIEENVLVAYYGKQRNDANYRLTVSSDEFKLIEFQKEVEGRYVTQSYFSPKADFFAGAYNLVGEYSSENFVWVFSSKFGKTTISGRYAGYLASTYYQRGRSLASESGLLVPGFCFTEVNEQRVVLTVAKLLDASDGQFFEGMLYTNSSTANIHLIYEGEISQDYFYADPYMFTQYVCNDEGALLTNYYSSYDPITWDEGDYFLIDNEQATYSVARGDKGLVYTFTVSESKVYNVTISANSYRYTVGNEAHLFAPLTGWFEIPGSYDDELVFVNDNLSHSLSMQYSDMDMDLWIDTLPVFYWDGELISNPKLTATDAGEVIFSFVDASEVEHKFLRGNSNVAIHMFGDSIDYYYNLAAVRELYQGTFICDPEGSIAIDELLYCTINQAMSSRCTIAYNANFGLYLYLDNEKDLAFVNIGAEGFRLCVLMSKSEQSQDYFLDANDFDKTVGEFTSNGTDSFALDSEYNLKVDGEALAYGLTLIEAGEDEYLVAIGYRVDTTTYFAILTFEGTIAIYRLASGSLVPVKTMCNKGAFDALVGKYQLDGQYGTESIEFREDGHLYLDNYIDGQLVPEEHQYSISVEDDVYTLNVIGQTSQGTYSLPFVLAENYTLTLNNLFYELEELHALRGTYGHKASKTTMLAVNGVIYINNQRQTLTGYESESAEGKLTSATFYTSTYTITLSYVGDDKVVSLYETAQGAGTAITFDDSDDRFLDFSKSYTQQLEGDQTATWKLATQYNSYNNKVETRLVYNEQYSGGSSYYLEYDDGGNLTVRGSAVMKNYRFYFYEDGNGVAVEL